MGIWIWIELNLPSLVVLCLQHLVSVQFVVILSVFNPFNPGRFRCNLQFIISKYISRRENLSISHENPSGKCHKTSLTIGQHCLRCHRAAIHYLSQVHHATRPLGYNHLNELISCISIYIYHQIYKLLWLLKCQWSIQNDVLEHGSSQGTGRLSSCRWLMLTSARHMILQIAMWSLFQYKSSGTVLSLNFSKGCSFRHAFERLSWSMGVPRALVDWAPVDDWCWHQPDTWSSKLPCDHYSNINLPVLFYL